MTWNEIEAVLRSSVTERDKHRPSERARLTNNTKFVDEKVLVRQRLTSSASGGNHTVAARKRWPLHPCRQAEHRLRGGGRQFGDCRMRDRRGGSTGYGNGRVGHSWFPHNLVRSCWHPPVSLSP